MGRQDDIPRLGINQIQEMDQSNGFLSIDWIQSVYLHHESIQDIDSFLKFNNA